jgi:Arc/MetJ-type ribon-helix-helix transcriptional regulator
MHLAGDANMIRTQVQLTEAQLRRLKALSAQGNRSVSDLVREGVDHVLSESERESRWSRLLEVAGKFHDSSRARDVSARHDRYLDEISAREARLR